MKSQQRREELYRNLYGLAPASPVRAYGGEWEGKLLAGMLNRFQGTTDGKRVASLLGDMQQLEESAPSVKQKARPRAARQPGDVARFVQTYAKIGPVLARVNTELAGTPQKLQLTITSGGRVDIDWMRGRGNALRPEDAMWPMLQLVRQGYLNRVRHCELCRKWFYARFRHQTFCGTICQQKHYRSSSEWKAHRSEWMRDYRQLKQSGKVK